MHYKAQCHVCFNVREFEDRTELWTSGKHDRMSHSTDKSAGLTDKQRLGIQEAVRVCPMQVGSVLVDRSKKFSPSKRILVSDKNVRAASRLVRRERQEVLSGDLLEGITIDGSNGAMTQVCEALSLPRLIARHNDPHDAFHLDAHQPVCCGYQFEDGVTYMTISTLHLLINLARAKNAQDEVQGHIDGSFGYCVKDFCLIGFGVNRLGAHFNPVSISISNTESKEGIKNAFRASTSGAYQVFRDIQRCENPVCLTCSMIRKADVGAFLQHRKSEKGLQNKFPVVPSSDNSHQFYSFAKEEFGPKTRVLQCGKHMSGISCYPSFPKTGKKC
jgi:hypothetical protein